MILKLRQNECREHVEQEILSNFNPAQPILGLTVKELLMKYWSDMDYMTNREYER